MFGIFFIYLHKVVVKKAAVVFACNFMIGFKASVVICLYVKVLIMLRGSATIAELNTKYIQT